jgi:hypothetical protein
MMTCLWIIGGVVLGGLFLAIQLGFLPPPHATTLLQIRNGQLRIRRGDLRPYAKGQVVEVLRETGVSRCFIAVIPGNRVRFSRSIPSTLHQRLRNIILNQWA